MDFKKIRLALNMSMKDVGNYCKGSRQYVHQIETDARPASQDFLESFLIMVEKKKKIIQKL